jgi:hypothetical protein
MSQNLKLLILALVLSSCSTMPSGPSVLVLPGTGKDFGQFRNDEDTCRQFAHAQLASAPKKPDSKDEGQQNYDISYVQCMYGKGHRVPVPEELMYDTRQEWHPPPPPDLPAPPHTAKPEPSANSSQ